jgi:ubiquinone/menaquinone biosynthesis C-methylase UbiE
MHLDKKTFTEITFDNWAKRGRAEGMETGHQPRAIQALQRIPLTPGQQVLDVGCGNGWATRWLRAQLGADGVAVGIDFSAEMIALSNTQLTSGLSFSRSAFENLPFETGAFDHIFSMEAIYYAVDLSSALNELARVHRPGGTLTLCIDFYEENPYSADWPDMLNVPMVRLSELGWRDAVAQAGYENIHTCRCFDPRPVTPSGSQDEDAAAEHFRREIGSLAITGLRQ